MHTEAICPINHIHRELMFCSVPSTFLSIILAQDKKNRQPRISSDFTQDSPKIDKQIDAILVITLQRNKCHLLTLFLLLA